MLQTKGRELNAHALRLWKARHDGTPSHARLGVNSARLVTEIFQI